MKRNNTGKSVGWVSKAAAVLLAAVLAVSVLPSAVFAEESVQSEAEAAIVPADPEVVKTNKIEGWPQAPDINSDYGCLMDYSTGTVLYSKGMNVKMPPASLTKIMTTLLAIENGDLDAVVTMTETGVAYATDGSSNLYTQVGEQFTLRDMLYGVMLKSANDMATQVGEFIGGGSLDTFIDMMNERAREIGCYNTNFVNACGMPADDHVTSAYDLCLICREALKNETFREIIRTKEYTIPATNMTEERAIATHHPFFSDPSYAYEGTLGGKTGYTDAALRTLATFVRQDDRTLICVTLHAEDMALACEDATALFDYGFANFTNEQVKKKADVLSGGFVTIPVGTDKNTLTKTTKDGTDSEVGKTLITTYSYSGHPVGNAVQSVAYLEEKKAAEEEAKRLAEAASAGESVSGAEEPVTTEVTPAVSHEGSFFTATVENVTLPLGITMSRTAFIAIAALALLILLGILLIIITVIARGGRDD